MLDKLRKQAAKILMSFLFGILILSFGVWGIGDIFRSTSRETAVAEIGGTEIRAAEFSRLLLRDINRLQTQFGGRLEIEQIRAFGIGERLLQEMISGALLDEQASDMGMIISEDQLKRRIVEEPVFHDEAGNFNRNLFVQALQLSNLSEQQYVSGLERDLIRAQLATAASRSVKVSRQFVDDFYRYRDERRIADTLTVPLGDGADLAEPDESALQEILMSFEERFQRPELRRVSLVELRAEDLIDEIRVSEEELQAEFEARREDFVKPERRSLEQVLFESQSEAAEFKAMLDGGKDFEAAAEAGDLTPVLLAELARDELAQQVPTLAEAAFALKVDQTSEPVESPFGWHVIRLAEILPPYEPVFEDQREALQAAIAERNAVDSLISLANQLDDELGGGATLEEAADSLGLATTEIPAIDRTGTDAAGERPDLPGSQEFLGAVFDAVVDETSLLNETADGDYYVFRVDEVTPPSTPALEEVRSDVVALWRREEARKKALIQAEALADRLRLGSDLAEIASAEGLDLGRTAPLNRFGSDPTAAASPELTSKLFGLALEEVAVAETPDGWVVLKLAEIQPGDPGANREAVDTLSDALAEALQNDVLSAFTRELQRDIGVTVNQGAIDTVLSAY